MTSKRKKGQNWVNEVKEMFEKAGFTCWKPASKAIFIGKGRVISQSQDIFECYDLVATSTDVIIWIQVKSDESDCSKARKKINELPMPLDSIRLVMMRIPNKKYQFKTWHRIWGTEWSKPSIVAIDKPENIMKIIR
jgi:hypothetical protein